MEKRKPNPKVPYIREIIDLTSAIGGQRIEGNTREEMRTSISSILDKQFARAKNAHVGTKTY